LLYFIFVVLTKVLAFLLVRPTTAEIALNEVVASDATARANIIQRDAAVPTTSYDYRESNSGTQNHYD
jgi:hypothetical protein